MKVSIVVPVFNEAAIVVDSLSRLRASASNDAIEIILADGGSTDGTVEAAMPFVDRVVVPRRPGRAIQMHEGALAATGELLLFLHIDTRLPEGWLSTLIEAWSQEDSPACTAFQLSFDGGGTTYRLIEWATRLRFRWTKVPHGDQAIAVKRQVYLDVGGFPYVPLMEEYYLARRLAAKGATRLLSESVLTSRRRYEKNGPVRNALRNSLFVGLFHLGVGPATLAKWYG